MQEKRYQASRDDRILGPSLAQLDGSINRIMNPWRAVESLDAFLWVGL